MSSPDPRAIAVAHMPLRRQSSVYDYRPEAEPLLPSPPTSPLRPLSDPTPSGSNSYANLEALRHLDGLRISNHHTSLPTSLNTTNGSEIMADLVDEIEDTAARYGWRFGEDGMKFMEEGSGEATLLDRIARLMHERPFDSELAAEYKALVVSEGLNKVADDGSEWATDDDVVDMADRQVGGDLYRLGHSPVRSPRSEHRPSLPDLGNARPTKPEESTASRTAWFPAPEEVLALERKDDVTLHFYKTMPFRTSEYMELPPPAMSAMEGKKELKPRLQLPPLPKLEAISYEQTAQGDDVTALPPFPIVAHTYAPSNASVIEWSDNARSQATDSPTFSAGSMQRREVLGRLLKGSGHKLSRSSTTKATVPGHTRSKSMGEAAPWKLWKPKTYARLRQASVQSDGAPPKAPLMHMLLPHRWDVPEEGHEKYFVENILPQQLDQRDTHHDKWAKGVANEEPELRERPPSAVLEDPIIKPIDKSEAKYAQERAQQGDDLRDDTTEDLYWDNKLGRGFAKYFKALAGKRIDYDNGLTYGDFVTKAAKMSAAERQRYVEQLEAEIAAANVARPKPLTVKEMVAKGAKKSIDVVLGIDGSSMSNATSGTAVATGSVHEGNAQPRKLSKDWKDV